jgi:pentatricopeptide repeat protein
MFDPTPPVAPCVRCYNRLFARPELGTKQLPQLLQIFHQMQQWHQIEENTLSLVVRVLVGGGQVDEAWRLAKELRKAIVPKRRTYAPILQGFVALSRMEEAFDVFNAMPDRAPADYILLAGLCRLALLPYHLMLMLTGLQLSVDELCEADGQALSIALSSPRSPAAITCAKENRCSHCSRCLPLVPLSEQEVGEFDSMIQTKTRNVAFASHLSAMHTWLVQKHGVMYVLDGANIGYYGQNRDGGCFSVAQIQQMLHLCGVEQCVIILPARYFGTNAHPVIPNHSKCGGKKSGQELFSTLSEAEIGVLGSWEKEGRLWVVPDVFDDDVCWMAATMGKTMGRAGGAGEGGGRRLRKAITNDAMRNHWCGLVPLTFFRRWKRSRVIQYTLDSSSSDGVQLLEHSHSRVIHPPPVHSPLTSAVATMEGAWHFPVAGLEDGWLCATVS